MSDAPETDAAWLEQKDMVILCRKLERERDDLLSQDYRTEARAMRYCQERDEARNDIIGWENKWKCAIDMAARAELERDEALQDAKDLAQQMSESNQVLQAEVRDYRKKERANS